MIRRHSHSPFSTFPVPPVSTGLVHYLHAGVGVNLSGGVFSTWTDKVNNVTWNISPYSVNNPDYSDTGFNGKPGLYLNNSEIARGTNLTFGNTYSIFELSDNTNTLLSLAGANYNDGGYFLFADSSNTYHSANGEYHPWAVGSSAHLGIHTRSIIRSATSAELIIDGVSKGSVTYSSSSSLFLSAVGDYWGVNNSAYQGTIRCQLAYNRTLNSTEISQILDFLNSQM